MFKKNTCKKKNKKKGMTEFYFGRYKIFDFFFLLYHLILNIEYNSKI